MSETGDDRRYKANIPTSCCTVGSLDGKTAPRLLEDLNSYDPFRPPVGGFNILVELPRQYENGNVPKIPRNKHSCQHKWDVKDGQCYIPLMIGRPDPRIVSTVAAFCEHCRCHLELSIDFPTQGTTPCHSKESPLHHFQHQPELSQPLEKGVDPVKTDSSGDWQVLHWFQCSTLDCSARVKIQIKSPRLRPEWVELLIDKRLIKSRAEKAIFENPDRFEGHGVPLPCEVLQNLGKYVSHALRREERRPIQPHNKKFLLCLGDPCTELLEFLGFVLKDDAWHPPQSDVSATPPISNSVNVLLEDVEMELHVLLLQRPDDEKRASKVQYDLRSATDDLSRVLGTVKCKPPPGSMKSLLMKEDKLNSSTLTTNSQGQEHPCYPSLGAKLDFHDDLIRFAYERQLITDPEHYPYYLECLQTIAEGRQSEDLQTLVAIEASAGKVSVRDIRNAYKALDLEVDSGLLTDDYIIGSFQSRAADSPRQEPELRRALQIVGNDRSSQAIQFVASKTVTNYEQALSWLGATEDMDDNFVVAMYKVKEEENPAEENTARQAISMIAQHRKSTALTQWLQTGVLGEVDMDTTQAYNRLQIDDRTADDELVLATFNLAYQEAPSQVDDLRSALRAIAKDRNSKYLHNFLNHGTTTSGYPLGEWPVGLANIGNTCYLNSLLQFYFTMKPLRQLVLDFDEYKLDVNLGSQVKRTVGSRNVSLQEVQRAQRFVYGLQNLFSHMIASPSAHVTPELELARLTLLSQPVEAVLRRRSTVDGERPSLGNINGQPILGPLPLSIPEITTSDVKPIESQAVNGVNNAGVKQDTDTSSELTLLGNELADGVPEQETSGSNPVESQQREILENKENLPPTKAASERQSTPDHELKPLAESSPSRTNQQHRLVETDHELPTLSSPKKVEEPAVAPPPTRPPPFPPRPQTEEQKKAVMEEVQFGAQQDVTEVIANVLFQLECAIKATSFDPSGEQIDLVKELFFGKQKSYTPDLRGGLRTNEQYFSSLIVDVASGPKEIYDALDGAFDVQEVEVEGSLRPQYTTITRMPPVLKIHVQRVQYDREKGSAFKSINHLDLREIVYMDRYMDSEDNDLIQRRKESWDWKRELRQLEARKLDLTKTELDMEVPDMLETTKEYLAQLAGDDAFEVPTHLLEDVAKAAVESREELAVINARIKDLTRFISSQFNDEEFRKMPYRLQSVFIHIGSASYGHYWIYIRDFKKNMWRKYNDESVSAVTDISQIFDPEPGDRPPTPYFLVYVRDDLKDELVDPVCREVNEAQQSGPPDAFMEDVIEDPPVVYDNAGQGEVATEGNWFTADAVKTQQW
ncbi:MAG: hypothetical protein Q9181_000698 [Wetmoreana brouardii]